MAASFLICPSIESMISEWSYWIAVPSRRPRVFPYTMNEYFVTPREAASSGSDAAGGLTAETCSCAHEAIEDTKRDATSNVLIFRINDFSRVRFHQPTSWHVVSPFARFPLEPQRRATQHEFSVTWFAIKPIHDSPFRKAQMPGRSLPRPECRRRSERGTALYCFLFSRPDESERQSL